MQKLEATFSPCNSVHQEQNMSATSQPSVELPRESASVDKLQRKKKIDTTYSPCNTVSQEWNSPAKIFNKTTCTTCNPSDSIQLLCNADLQHQNNILQVQEAYRASPLLYSPHDPKSEGQQSDSLFPIISNFSCSVCNQDPLAQNCVFLQYNSHSHDSQSGNQDESLFQLMYNPTCGTDSQFKKNFQKEQKQYNTTPLKCSPHGMDLEVQTASSKEENPDNTTPVNSTPSDLVSKRQQDERQLQTKSTLLFYPCNTNSDTNQSSKMQKSSSTIPLNFRPCETESQDQNKSLREQNLCIDSPKFSTHYLDLDRQQLEYVHPTSSCAVSTSCDSDSGEDNDKSPKNRKVCNYSPKYSSCDSGSEGQQDDSSCPITISSNSDSEKGSDKSFKNQKVCKDSPKYSSHYLDSEGQQGESICPITISSHSDSEEENGNNSSIRQKLYSTLHPLSSFHDSEWQQQQGLHPATSTLSSSPYFSKQYCNNFSIKQKLYCQSDFLYHRYSHTAMRRNNSSNKQRLNCTSDIKYSLLDSGQQDVNFHPTTTALSSPYFSKQHCNSFSKKQILYSQSNAQYRSLFPYLKSHQSNMVNYQNTIPACSSASSHRYYSYSGKQNDIPVYKQGCDDSEVWCISSDSDSEPLKKRKLYSPPPPPWYSSSDSYSEEDEAVNKENTALKSPFSSRHSDSEDQVVEIASTDDSESIKCEGSEENSKASEKSEDGGENEESEYYGGENEESEDGGESEGSEIGEESEENEDFNPETYDSFLLFKANVHHNVPAEPIETIIISSDDETCSRLQVKKK